MSSAHRPTVLLFDIDGTLISSGGVGRRAVEATLLEHFGVSGLCEFGFGGMTDRGIFRRALESRRSVTPDLEPLDDDATEAIITELIDHYVDLLAHNLDVLTRSPPADSRSGFVVHPGVGGILRGVSERDGVAVGLGTGNVERGARIKLEPAGLNGYFGFGGFGCDAELRADLIAAGARRGAQALGKTPDQCRVVIIGDTPRDVSAAHAIGAECVAVATGYSSHAELAACGAEVTIDDLTAPGLLDFLLA